MKNNSNNPSRTRDLNREFITNNIGAQEYTQEATNRSGAQDLLNHLKSRGNVEQSKIIWKDKQPTLVTTTRAEYKTFPLHPNLSDGTPATDTTDRVPSSWESKRDRRDRQTYTLDETPTMAFKSSGQLPAHYYMDESALEAYVQSLTNE